MKNIVIMKYLNGKDMPCYKRITDREMAGSNKFREEFMEIEKQEMLNTGEMKKHLWTKSVDETEYKQLFDTESKIRMETLERLDRIWEEV